MQNSVQNGRCGTRPSRKRHNGLDPAIEGTTSTSSGFVLQETQRNPIPSVNLRALCEKCIGSSPLRGGVGVHPWSKPAPSDSRSFAVSFLLLSLLESAGWEMPRIRAAARWFPPACLNAD